MTRGHLARTIWDLQPAVMVNSNPAVFFHRELSVVLPLRYVGRFESFLFVELAVFVPSASADGWAIRFGDGDGNLLYIESVESVSRE